MSIATSGGYSPFFPFCLQEGYGKQQQSGMIKKYQNESTFMVFIFSEVAKVVCEE